jgi:hypothetical protein
MEDILTYLIVFGLIIGGVAVWQFRRGKPRPYILSIQYYPELQLRVLVQKQEGKTKDLAVHLQSTQTMGLQDVFVELISKSRNFERVALSRVHTSHEFPLTLKAGQSVTFTYPFDAFKHHLQHNAFSFKTFRLVAEDLNGKKYKSHELAFNKNWVIYRPDTGTFN